MNDIDIEETLRNIKKEFRASMNGVASKHMRDAGFSYRINFGIELPRLQAIARDFAPNHRLAQHLWDEQVRESKILATLLMPLERYSAELADIWVGEIPNAEIAQQATMNLFARLSFAPSLAFEWIASGDEIRQLCGWLLVSRLLMQGAEFNARSLEELHDQMEAAQHSPSLHIRKAVQNAQSRLNSPHP